MNKYFLITFLLFCTILKGHTAQSYDFVIKEHNVHISVNKDSVLDIKETYLIEFNEPRRGIILDIPYIYKEGEEKGNAKRPNLLRGNYRTLFYDLKVEGAEVKKTNNGYYKEIRLGSPDIYIEGEQKYVVSYKVFGAVNFFKDHSEIYWNIHGNYWDVPAEKVDFSISLPAPIKLSKEDMFAVNGYYGDAIEDTYFSFNGKIMEGGSLYPLKPEEGLSVGIKLPEKYLSYGTPWLRLKLFIVNNLYAVAVLTYMPLLFLFWYKKGRNEKLSPITTLYHPPVEISPSVAGVLADDDIDNRDLVAALLRWAAKGVMKIEEVEDQAVLFTKTDYIFTKQNNIEADAPKYEKTLFSGMFPADIKNRRLSSMQENFYTTMDIARDELNLEIEQLGLYVEKTRAFRSFMLFLGIIIIFSGVFFAGITEEIGWFITNGIIGFATFAFGKVMPKRSEKGEKLYVKLAGFKEFVNRAEKDKLQRMLEENPEYFNITVPYAVAFGMLDKWASKFDGLLKSPPSWYISSGKNPFNVVRFASSLNRGVTAMSRTMTSRPAPKGGAGGGRSGFGGGGGRSSGGGFGGGGGRSW